MNKRYRIVTRQNGRPHVSSVVLTYEEAVEQLLAEKIMHEETGWYVSELTPIGQNNPVMLVCSKKDTVRSITVRERGPFDDD